MALKKEWLKFLGNILFLLLIGIVAPKEKVEAQSILLRDVSRGTTILGGVASIDNINGPIAGISYSANGLLDFGISYSNYSGSSTELQSVAFSSNILLSKQYDGDPFNFELIPSIQRSYSSGSESDINQTVVTLGAAISRDLAATEINPSYMLIPRVSFLYSNYFIDGNNSYPSVGVPNSNNYVVSLDIIGGIRLTNSSKMIINPGYAYNLKDEVSGWTLTAGLLFY